MVGLARFLGSCVGAAGIILVAFAIADWRDFAQVSWPWRPPPTAERAATAAPDSPRLAAAETTIEALQSRLATSEALPTIPPPNEVSDEDLTAIAAERDAAWATVETLQSQLATSEAAVAASRVDSQSSEAQTDEESPPTIPSPPPAALTTYTSPNFGYELSWQEPWSASHQEASAPDETSAFDQLVLTNGVSSVAFSGTMSFAGDSQRCLDGVVQAIRNRTGSVGIRSVDVAIGAALPAGDRLQVSNAYEYTTETDGSSVRRIAAITCITLTEGQSNLVVIDSAPSTVFAGQVAPRDELVARLMLPD